MQTYIAELVSKMMNEREKYELLFLELLASLEKMAEDENPGQQSLR